MRGHSMCKDPEAEKNWMYLQNSKTQHGWSVVNDRGAGEMGGCEQEGLR